MKVNSGGEVAIGRKLLEEGESRTKGKMRRAANNRKLS